MDDLFYQLVLSHTAILRKYLMGELINRDSIDLLVFVESRNIHPGLPDYVHKSYRESSINGPQKSGRKTIAELLYDSYEALAEKYLCFRKYKIHANSDTFESWQKMLTRLTPLPLVSFAIFRDWVMKGCTTGTVRKIIGRNLEKSTLPSIFHPFVKSLIENEGLNELHLHLNGTTELDRVWQDALCDPWDLFNNIRAPMKNEPVREQYLQLDDYIDEPKLCYMLKLARILRDLMVRYMFHGERIDRKKLKKTMNIEYPYPINHKPLGNYQVHPMETIPPGSNRPDFFSHSKMNHLQNEAAFMIHAFRHLRAKGNSMFAHAMYCYILIQAYFNKLLVQQLSQCGFDQFQKITLNEIRNISEQEYVNRYVQSEGLYDQDLVFLEGRFSPKESIVKNYKLLKNIVHGFQTYSGPKKRMCLKLVGHFIKKKDKKYCFCRHYHLRKDTERRARALAAVLRNSPEFRSYTSGIDAAANELHTPPEVYAPTFRRFKREGFTDFTYHVGEDYIHLVSGIRAIYEAVTFLELNEKNRIGHATAVGIRPGFWMKKLGGKIMLEKGEWLDSLVFAYMILSEHKDFIQLLNKIKDKVCSLYREIYNDDTGIDIHLLIQAWEMRNLDPLIAFDPTRRKHDALNKKEWDEWGRIEKAKKEKHAYKLFEKYHSQSVVKNCKTLVPVDTGFIDSHAISFLQRKTIELLNLRGIAIESMPTSNVRISYYDDYKEHHIFRWLNIDGDGGIPKPVVCLSSDDPGIFATNLRNEFSHVFRTLVEYYRQDPRKAMLVLKELNENARVYRFGD